MKRVEPTAPSFLEALERGKQGVERLSLLADPVDPRRQRLDLLLDGLGQRDELAERLGLLAHRGQVSADLVDSIGGSGKRLERPLGQSQRRQQSGEHAPPATGPCLLRCHAQRSVRDGRLSLAASHKVRRPRGLAGRCASAQNGAAL